MADSRDLDEMLNSLRRPSTEDTPQPRVDQPRQEPAPQQPAPQSARPAQKPTNNQSVMPARRDGDDGEISVAGGRQQASETGWRGFLNRFGLNIGRSEAEQEMDGWVRSINQAGHGYPQVVAFVGPKGGGGKTISAVNIGSTIAKHRSAGGVVGVDVDEASLLVRRMKPVTGKPSRGKSVSSFAADTSLESEGRPKVNTYLTTNEEGFSALPGVALSGDSSPSREQIASSLQTLARHFDLILVDAPGAREADNTRATIDMADGMVYVMSTSPDAMWLGRRHLEQLASQYPRLIEHTVVLLNHQTGGRMRTDLDKEVDAIQRISTTGDPLPVFETAYDPHIAEGGGLSVSLTDKNTQRDYVKISAALMETLDFGTPTRVLGREFTQN